MIERRTVTDVISQVERICTEEDSWEILDFEKILSTLWCHFTEEQKEGIFNVLKNIKESDLTMYELERRIKRDGLFKVPVKVVSGEGYPSLMFRYNKYLHWFRGMYFQVSSTESGHMTEGSSDGTLSHDLHVFDNLENKCDNGIPLKSWVVFSHICQAINKFEDLKAHLDNDVTEMDKFLEETYKEYYKFEKSNKYSDFINAFKKMSNLPDTKDSVVSYLCEFSYSEPGINKCFAILCFSKTFIAIRRYDKKEWTVFNVPKELNHDQLHVIYDRIPWILFYIEEIIMNIVGTYPSTHRGILKDLVDILPDTHPNLIRNSKDYWRLVEKIMEQ